MIEIIKDIVNCYDSVCLSYCDLINYEDLFIKDLDLIKMNYVPNRDEYCFGTFGFKSMDIGNNIKISYTKYCYCNKLMVSGSVKFTNSNAYKNNWLPEIKIADYYKFVKLENYL